MEPDFPDGLDLVEGIRSGNRRAERVICERYLPRVKCMLRARLRDEEAVGELANEVLFALVKTMREGRLREAGALPAFVFGIASNLINNYVRTKARRREQPLEPGFDPPAPVEDRRHEERLDRARRELDDLEEPDRTILLLVLLEGLTPAEIGRKIALSSEVVRARKSRAIKRLVARLQTSTDDEGGKSWTG
jgi:RNA polymerase sigma factor (sigma-70 family)